MTGLISGSSIANTVTTGTFTIPIMKKTGFSKEKAGAIEVSSSVNGQIMPPVMGAAAFVMASFIGVTYYTAKSTSDAQGKNANSPAPSVKYSSPLSAFSIVIISVVVVLRFFKYTYDLV